MLILHLFIATHINGQSIKFKTLALVPSGGQLSFSITTFRPPKMSSASSPPTLGCISMLLMNAANASASLKVCEQMYCYYVLNMYVTANDGRSMLSYSLGSSGSVGQWFSKSYLFSHSLRFLVPKHADHTRLLVKIYDVAIRNECFRKICILLC